MRKYLIGLVFLLFVTTVQARERDSVLVVFWNLENFFDYIDQGTGESDRQFSSLGSKHWTKKKFFHKCDMIAKSLMWMGDRYGRMPDVIGLAEIENRGVLYKLLNNTLLRKYDYETVHFDSGDRRGIDVALLYKKSMFQLLDVSLKVPEFEGKTMKTRDILHVQLACLSGSAEKDTVNLIVNHHPSKFGGAKESEEKRDAAMIALKQLCDSIITVKGGPVISMGDFNDTPDGPSFRIMEGKLENKGMSLFESGQGTIRYEGKWDLIDMFLVSPEISGYTKMEICRIPFLMTWEKRHPGEKPLRTYSGPRYIGGVSDHCPIILWYFPANS